MEKKDFPKGTKPREIFVYTCERIAEPLIPLGYKYRKSKNEDVYKRQCSKSPSLCSSPMRNTLQAIITGTSAWVTPTFILSLIHI